MNTTILFSGLNSQFSALECLRMDDFLHILIYQTAQAVMHSFNGQVYRLYQAPINYANFCHSDRKQSEYSKLIYKDICRFNHYGLTAKQLKAFFGKEPNTTIVLNYLKLIDSMIQANLIIRFNQGSIVIKDKRYHFSTRYFPTQAVFEQFWQQYKGQLTNAKSNLYSKRQTRLIFSQLITKAQAKKKLKQSKTLTNTALQIESEQELSEFVDSLSITL